MQGSMILVIIIEGFMFIVTKILLPMHIFTMEVFLEHRFCFQPIHLGKIIM